MSDPLNLSLPLDSEEIYTESQLIAFLKECFGTIQNKGGRACVFLPWRGGFCYVLPPRKGFPSAKLFVDDGSNRPIDPIEVFCNTVGKGLSHNDFQDKYNELIRKHEEEVEEEDNSTAMFRSKFRKALEKLLQDFGI